MSVEWLWGQGWGQRTGYLSLGDAWACGPSWSTLTGCRGTPGNMPSGGMMSSICSWLLPEAVVGAAKGAGVIATALLTPAHTKMTLRTVPQFPASQPCCQPCKESCFCFLNHHRAICPLHHRIYNDWLRSQTYQARPSQG